MTLTRSFIHCDSIHSFALLPICEITFHLRPVSASVTHAAYERSHSQYSAATHSLRNFAKHTRVRPSISFTFAARALRFRFIQVALFFLFFRVVSTQIWLDHEINIVFVFRSSQAKTNTSRVSTDCCCASGCAILIPIEQKRINKHLCGEWVCSINTPHSYRRGRCATCSRTQSANKQTGRAVVAVAVVGAWETIVRGRHSRVLTRTHVSIYQFNSKYHFVESGSRCHISHIVEKSMQLQ